MGVKYFKSLLISIPKCIELNPELILVLVLVLGLGLGSHPGPKSYSTTLLPDICTQKTPKV